MITENKEMKLEDLACFEVNGHGRLLNANRRFCRMFGFKETDIPWHYIRDLYRHKEDWIAYQNCCASEGARIHFVTRMKNRRGRSFKCSLSRVILKKDNGQSVYRNVVRKLESIPTSHHAGKTKNTSLVTFKKETIDYLTYSESKEAVM